MKAREATYSSVAYGGWVVVVAGLSQMVMWNWGLINGAADAGDDAALHSLSYVAYFGWAGMGIGLATAFIATGLGGIRSAVLPRWFAILTLVLGVARRPRQRRHPTRRPGQLRAAPVLADRRLDRRRQEPQACHPPRPARDGYGLAPGERGQGLLIHPRHLRPGRGSKPGLRHSAASPLNDVLRKSAFVRPPPPALASRGRENNRPAFDPPHRHPHSVRHSIPLVHLQAMSRPLPVAASERAQH